MVRVATFAAGVATGAFLVGVAVLLLGPWWVPATSELVPPYLDFPPKARWCVTVLPLLWPAGRSADSRQWTSRPSLGRARGGQRRRVSARSGTTSLRTRPSARRATAARRRNEVVPLYPGEANTPLWLEPPLSLSLFVHAPSTTSLDRCSAVDGRRIGRK